MHTPLARKDELLVREVDDELLVYDLTRHKAHCLNRTAVLIWNRCNGRATLPQIASSVEAELGEPVSETVVWLAVDRLARARLLDESRASVTGDASCRRSRREALRRISLAGGMAFALPAVWSIVAPTAAYAATGCNTNECQGGIPNGTCCCNTGGMLMSCMNGMCNGAPGTCMCPGQC